MTGPLSHVSLRYVDNLDTAMEFMRWLGERRRVLGVDTEGGGFSPERNRLRMIQFGDLDTGWAIPWERWNGVGLEALKKYDKPLVLHNSKFDARFISRHGDMKWPWHLTNDTMAMAHILNPLRSKGLKPLSAMLVDPQAATAQRALDDAMHNHKWTWDSIPVDFQLYWVYAAMDPVLTCHIYEKFYEEIQASYSQVYDMEMGVTRIVAGMETRGARVDLPYCETKQTELLEWAAQARTWLGHEYGLHNFTDMKLLKFFTDNNITMLYRRTKSGMRQALDKEVLLSIDHPVAKYVLAIRKAEKNVGPYFKNFLAMADSNDRVHPNVWTMGTRTARMSITDPALQTLPRKDPTVRTAFIPSEGGRLYTIDADQIEARLAAHFSEDPGLIEAFATAASTGADFFCNIASQIFGEPISKKDERRQLTKNTVYGKLYGAGAPKMAATAGVPLSVMEPVVQGFDHTFPGILRMQRRINATARQRFMSEGEAYINTPTGRRMIADDNKEYTLTNYLIQCHAAEILKRKMIEIDAVLPGQMILPVHDELVFDFPGDEAEEMARIASDTMNRSDGYRVPITWSGDLLTADWGEKYRAA